jgi:hypothetical protein
MASPLELQRHNDRTPDTKALEGPKDLPGVDRSSLLAGLKLLPEQKQTANLHEVKVEGAKAVQLAAVGKVPADSALKTLQSADATAQQKIEAVSKLYDTMPKDAKGRVHITLHDGDKDKQFEISKEKLGHGVSLTHLTYRDENGHNHPVLRGVERNGQIDQEQDKHGSKADFKGDWWSKHAGDSAISKFAQSTDAPLPPVRPHHLDQPDTENSDRPAPLPPVRPHHLGQPDTENSDRPAPLPPVRPHHLGQPDADRGPEHRPEHKIELEPQRKPAPERDGPTDRENGKFVKTSDLHKFWTVQPSKVECGSSAEAMAIAHLTGRGPLSGAEIQRLSHENGTFSDPRNYAFHHGENSSNMAHQLRSHGLKAETHQISDKHAEMAKLDEELAKGRSAVVYIRNPDTASHHGHFIYVAGKVGENQYLIGNSGSHLFRDKRPATREQLTEWMGGPKKHESYFTSVWS